MVDFFFIKGIVYKVIIVNYNNIRKMFKIYFDIEKNIMESFL